MWMFLAQKLAEMGGNCKRKQTGAVIISKHGVYVAGAYNRIQDDRVCTACPREGKQSGKWSGAECGVEHAEARAIGKAREHHISMVGGTIYSTYKPCMACAVAIVDAGIVKVIYRDEYPGGGDVAEYLAANGVQLVKEG